MPKPPPHKERPSTPRPTPKLKSKPSSKPPFAKPAFKAANDQQYMTLNGLDDKVFAKSGDKAAPPANKHGERINHAAHYRHITAFKAANDQQYMTLAGLDNQVFAKPNYGPNKNAAAPPPANKHGRFRNYTVTR